jgi:hypothetical protein
MHTKLNMNSTDEKIIALSKTKIVLLLLGACAFVAIGFWMFSLDEAVIRSQRRHNDPLYVHGIGLAAILFFGPCGLYALKKLFDKKPGLVFNNSGIVDNASAVAAGLIPWSDVVDTQVCEIQKQKILVINVKDPQKYIDRGNALKRALNKANYKMVGSAITISAHTLEIDFPDLVSLFDEYQRKYCVSPGRADTRHPLHAQDTPYNRGIF